MLDSSQTRFISYLFFTFRILAFLIQFPTIKNKDYLLLYTFWLLKKKETNSPNIKLCIFLLNFLVLSTYLWGNRTEFVHPWSEQW